MVTLKTGAVAGLVFAATMGIVIGAGIHPSRAQEASGQPGQMTSGIPGLEILATPYAWIPWTSIGATPSNSRIPSASTTIDPYQMISHLTWVPFMGAAEFRSGDFGLVTDYIHAPLKAGVSTKGVIFGSGTLGMTVDTGTAMFLYRAWVQPDQSLDIGAGVRVWGLDGDISLNRRVLAPVSVSSGEAWADPLIAIRYHRDLGNGFGATAYGDVGGFGLGANVDWQLIGTIDYTWKPGVDLHAGFRSLNFDFGASRADLTMHMYGPILAATFRF